MPAPPPKLLPGGDATGLAREARLRQRAEQVRQILETLPLSVAVAFALAILTVAALWRHVQPVPALAWVAAIGVTSALRLALYFRLRRRGGDFLAVLRQLPRLRVLTVLAGMCWGASVVLLYDPHELIDQLLLLFVLAGLTAGSASSMGADRAIAFSFQFPVLLPVVVRLALTGDRLHLGLSAMVLLYATYLGAAVFRMSAQTSRNIQLRLRGLKREQVLFESETRYRLLAHHDALTGLPNRFALQGHLANELDGAAREGRRAALLYIDLDDFKDINDTRGHAAGDRVLVEVAARLRASVRASDMVARMGGDEFIVVTQEAVTREEVALLAERVRRAIAEPLELGEDVLATRASIGIGLFPLDGQDAAQLMKHADTALYQAKARGRNGFQFYDAGMSVAVSERLFLERALLQALDAGAIDVRYQPILSLPSAALVGFEALAAWQHPERGAIPPATFVAVAEQCGLIERLGEHVLRTVIAQISEWRDARLPLVPVAINVSARQLERGQFPSLVEAAARERGVDLALLQFEITESLLVGHMDKPMETLQALRRLGARVAIDDFGTGYSSLSYLKHLPIDGVKVDRSFVRDMQQDARDAAIVSAIVGIAHSLGLSVVAEGVEGAFQAERLAALGCDAAQGFHFYGPLEPAQARALLLALRERHSPSDTLRSRIHRWVKPRVAERG